MKNFCEIIWKIETIVIPLCQETETKLKLKIMKIVIAPNLNEIAVKDNGHIFEVEYNGLRIEFILNGTLNKDCWNAMKRHIQQAIALSSKHWQVKWLLDGLKTDTGKQLGITNVYEVTTGKCIND